MKAKNQNVKFRIRSIKTPQFAVIEDNFTVGKEVKLNIEFEFGIHKNIEWLACTSVIRFRVNKSPFIIIAVRCDFEIDKESWQSLIGDKDSDITFPVPFLQNVAASTFSTARGVLFVKLEDSKFKNMILPSTNMNSFIKAPMTFDLEPESESAS